MNSSGAASDGRRTLGEWLKFFFTAHGRIGRAEYVLTSIGAYVTLGIGLGLADIASQPGVETINFGVDLALLVLLVAPIWIAICALVKRFHDLDMSGAWVFGSMIPIVGFCLSLMLIFRFGTPGANQYGTRPGHTDTATYTPPGRVYESLPDRRDIVSW